MFEGRINIVRYWYFYKNNRYVGKTTDPFAAFDMIRDIECSSDGIYTYKMVEVLI
jgi:hypothetical protein